MKGKGGKGKERKREGVQGSEADNSFEKFLDPLLII